MSEVARPVEIIQQTCRAKKSDGSRCSRAVAEGEGFCWQHARSWRNKWESLTRNQSLLFILTVLGVILGLVGLRQLIPSPPRGFIQLGKIWFNKNKISIDERLQLSVWIKNKGGEPVDNVFRYFEVRVVSLSSDPYANDRETHSLFLKDALQAHANMINDGHKGVTLGACEGLWNTLDIPTFPYPALTQAQVDGLLHGSIRIYVFVWARWKDAPHDLDLCNWLQPPPSGTKIDNDSLVWHLCSD
jgi:hypothetical protein